MSVIVSTPSEDPFRINTDPRLAHFDAPRRQAVARLMSGLYQGEGLFLLTGEDGIGKTTLLRHLGDEVAALDGVRLLHTAPFIDCAPAADFGDIVAACSEMFQVGTPDPLLVARVLQDLADGEQMPAMLIDDADCLDGATLRALSTLANLRGGERRLLSAVLAGTPELVGRMAALLGPNDRLPPDRKIVLAPMGRADVERMIRHRLRQAGRPEGGAIGEVTAQSNGVPLQVLGLCRRMLRDEDMLMAAAAGAAIPAAGTPVPGLSVPETPALKAPPAAAAPVPEPAQMPQARATIGADEPLAPPAAPERSAPGLPPTDAAAGENAGWPGDRQFEPGMPKARDRLAAAAAAEPTGHIRYGADSAMRIGGAKWHDGGNRRRARRRALVAAGVALLVLATGWSLYDHTPRRLAETTAVSPAKQPFAAVLEPSHTPARAPADADALPSPQASQGLAPMSAEAETPSSATPASPEPWWRPSGAERLRADLPPFAPPPSAVADDVGAAASRREEAPPVAALSPGITPDERPVSRPTPPPEPVARPVATAKAPPPAAKPRPPVAAAVAPQPEADVTVATRVPEARQPLKGRDALLTAGDEQMANGDVQAARIAYQEAFDKGSAEAARRLAQSFDPRNVAAHSSDASAAEAILWYKDAARKGDRRSRGELHGLEVWLEDAAASGDGEARRVLQSWRTPAEPEGSDAQTEQ